MAASACFAGGVRAESLEARVEALFRPPLGERMALSPDGQRVAYTREDGRTLAIVTMSVEPPGPRRTIRVEPEPDAAGGPGAPATKLRFLRWATPIRLVFAPEERVLPLPPVTTADGRTMPNPDGPRIVSPILAVDADGGLRGTLVDAKDFQETPAEARRTLADLLRTTKELQATRNEPVHWRMPHLDILGFLPNDREQLVMQTRGGYSAPTQRLVDVRTGNVREFGAAWPMPPGDPLVFDAFRLKVVGERKTGVHPVTVWRDEELGRVQRELERKFPRRVVDMLDWNETRSRVLVRVAGAFDPGRVFVYQRPEDLVVEILQRAPWLNAAKLHDTRFFEFDVPDGARLSGYLTWPRAPRITPPPLVIVFPSGVPGSAQPAFDPEAQVLADLGLAVARLNHRSVAGVRREDLSALRTAIDRVSIDDARAVIAGIAARNPARPFDARRVVTLGRGFGGYLAVRAVQLHPDAFRCGVAFDAPLELRAWQRGREANGSAPERGRELSAGLLDHAGTDWKYLSVVEHADTLTSPVLLLVEPRRDAAVDASTEALRTALQRRGRAPDLVELETGFAEASPAARAAVYRRIEEFLHLHLDDAVVKVGPAREVP